MPVCIRVGVAVCVCMQGGGEEVLKEAKAFIAACAAGDYMGHGKSVDRVRLDGGGPAYKPQYRRLIPFHFNFTSVAFVFAYDIFG